jgi:hypothetical protein
MQVFSCFMTTPVIICHARAAVTLVQSSVTAVSQVAAQLLQHALMIDLYLELGNPGIYLLLLDIMTCKPCRA